MQDGLALPSSCCRCNKDTLKSKYCECFVMAVGKGAGWNVAQEVCSCNFLVGKWAARDRCTRLSTSYPRHWSPCVDSCRWEVEWVVLVVALGTPLLERKDKGSQSWQLRDCNNSLLRSWSGEQAMTSWIELENVHGSPSNDLLPWHLCKQRNLANSVWEKERRFKFAVLTLDLYLRSYNGLFPPQGSQDTWI